MSIDSADRLESTKDDIPRLRTQIPSPAPLLVLIAVPLNRPDATRRCRQDQALDRKEAGTLTIHTDVSLWIHSMQPDWRKEQTSVL